MTLPCQKEKIWRGRLPGAILLRMKHRSRSRHHHSYRHHDDGSLLGSFVKYGLLFVFLGAVGGVTWLALTPLEAPTREVVRPVAPDRLGPA